MREQLVKLSKTYTDNYTEASDKFLDAVVENNKKAVDFAVKTADQVSEQLPELPVDLPWADQVPTAAELGARYIDFVERAVELNREFTDRVLKTIQFEEVEVKVAPAKKAPAKKSTAKKSTAKKSTAKKASAKKSTAKKAAAPKATVSE